MRKSRVNLDKFKRGSSLPNKREGTAPILDLIRRQVSIVGPENFRAFVMPSPNMFDVDFLSGLGVPQSPNIVVCENNRTHFDLIRSRCSCPMTDGPLSVESRLAVAGGRFNLINLDFCGPLGRETVNSVLAIFGQRFLVDDGILVVTAKCGRDSKNKGLLFALSSLRQNPPPSCLQTQRELAMESLLSHPEILSKIRSPYHLKSLLKQSYREDRKSSTGSSLMYCFAAVYSMENESHVSVNSSAA